MITVKTNQSEFKNEFINDYKELFNGFYPDEETIYYNSSFYTLRA